MCMLEYIVPWEVNCMYHSIIATNDARRHWLNPGLCAHAFNKQLCTACSFIEHTKENIGQRKKTYLFSIFSRWHIEYRLALVNPTKLQFETQHDEVFDILLVTTSERSSCIRLPRLRPCRIDAPRNRTQSQPWSRIKMSSYQYSKYPCGDKTILKSSYPHTDISYAGKMAYWYWTSPQALTTSNKKWPWQ